MKCYEQSYGAAKIVTGSAHLLVTSKSKILIDFGMFQGENEKLNYLPLNFDAKKINALILTHGHLDHVGRLPILYKNGFNGRVFAHPATFDIAKTVLEDSAKLQEEDYKTKKILLFTKKEVKKIFKIMKKINIKYNKKIKVTKDIKATFKDAGHILGSSFIELEILCGNKKKYVVFSGDLGNKDNELLQKPKKPFKADVLFIESTYADRKHKSFSQSKDEFKNAIIQTLKNKGNVIIPAFAIEKAQLLLCLLKEMNEEKTLPKFAKVYLDSPMANKVTKIYKKWNILLNNNCKKFKNHPFEFPQLKIIKNKKESKKINNIKNGAIIIAGSGMCNGGRILHHLKHRITNPKNSIIFVGYQAKGTLGRKIIDGAKFITIFNKKISIRSKIYTINGFSAHADQKELIEWMKKFKKLNKIFLIHGEYDKQLIFKTVIKNKFKKNANIVEMGEKIYI